MGKLLAYLLALALAISTILVSYCYYGLNLWSYNGPPVHFTIEAGDGFAHINHQLKKEHLIYDARLFHHYSKYKDLLAKFRTGTFEIKPGSTSLDVLDTLLYGLPIATQVTIPEGKNLFEIAAILENKKVIKSKEQFIALAKNPEFVRSLGINADRIEGYLFPDTYQFDADSTEESVIKKMVASYNKEIAPLLETPSELSKEELLILASIVEKETGAKEERPLIAGVFYNRLKKRMRLQSDPTTIYGIFENYKGNLKKDDLYEPTPYNTYAISGLPVTPICNPGVAAIQAVLEPSAHNFLFFVSQNNGTHIFTENYKDHQKAVETYQKSRQFREGRSWRELSKNKLN